MIIVKKIKIESIAMAMIVLSNQSNIYAPHEVHSSSVHLQGVWLQAGHSASLQLGCVHLDFKTPHSQRSLMVEQENLH